MPSSVVRNEDLRRGVTTTVGPHRDELQIAHGDLDARTRLSQGRQRAATLALRLAAHEVVTEHVGSRPVLLLDDAFSELDEQTADSRSSERTTPWPSEFTHHRRPPPERAGRQPPRSAVSQTECCIEHGPSPDDDSRDVEALVPCPARSSSGTAPPRLSHS